MAKEELLEFDGVVVDIVQRGEVGQRHRAHDDELEVVGVLHGGISHDIPHALLFQSCICVALCHHESTVQQAPPPTHR